MEIKKIDLDQIDNLSSGTQVSPKIKTAKPAISTDSNMPKSSKNTLGIQIIILLIISGLGIFTGSWLKSLQVPAPGKTSSGQTVTAQIPSTGAKVGDVYGSANETMFKDHATGVVDKGGSPNGEGTHKLVRAGGVSQTVYLSSSVIDLDQLVGHQVTVWGETNKGQKVGWLMDVGRAKIENLNVPLPK